MVRVVYQCFCVSLAFVIVRKEALLVQIINSGCIFLRVDYIMQENACPFS